MKSELPAASNGSVIVSKIRAHGKASLTLRQERMQEWDQEYKKQTKYLIKVHNELKKKFAGLA